MLAEDPNYAGIVRNEGLELVVTAAHVVGQVGLEPCPELRAERLGLGRVAEVHV